MFCPVLRKRAPGFFTRPGAGPVPDFSLDKRARALVRCPISLWTSVQGPLGAVH